MPRPKWLEHHDLDPEPASLLDALNKNIDEDADDEFAVGPSYLMTADGSARRHRAGLAPRDQARCSRSTTSALVRDIEAEFGPKGACSDQVAS